MSTLLAGRGVRVALVAILLALVMVWAAGLASAASVTKKPHHHAQGIVLHNQTNAHFCPAIYCPTEKTYDKGDRVTILKRVKGFSSAGGQGDKVALVYWYEVQIGHRIGYVLVQDVKVVHHHKHAKR